MAAMQRQPDDPGVEPEEEDVSKDTKQIASYVAGGLLIWFLAALVLGI